MKKKLIGIFLSIAMVSVLITGCGGSDTGAKQEETAQEETADTDADETDSAEEEDVEDEADSAKSSTEGGQLVIPVSATVTNLNPLLESMAEGAFQLSPFADELYYVDQEETRYYLAESCEVSEDGLTYTLKLKDNLKWHDGEPITADDVIFTADCNADTNNGAGYTNTVFIGEEPVKYEKYLAWNKYSDTWKDRDAVKALFAALDQNEIVEGAYGASMGIPANTIFSNQNLFHDEELTGYEQDLDTAKELAEKSGLSGKTIKLHYNTDRSYMEETALLIQQQLKAIDVNVEIEGIDANGFFEVVFTDQADYELYLNEYAAIGDPDSVVAGMYDGTWGVNVDTSDEILDLFKQGRETTDMEERAEIYKELQQKAIDEYLVYPIAYPNYCFVTSDNLQGAEYYETTPVFEDYTKLYFE